MKKILCIALAILLCVGGVVYAFSDIDNTDKNLNKAVDLMTKFGILNGYEDGTFRPYNEITRAEFSKVIIATIMTEEKVDGSEMRFIDVGDGHWAKNYIYLSRKVGIVSGMTIDTFAPENKITYEQAIKMIVASLGYDKRASECGGWPNGYITVAQDLGITKGVSFDGEKNATRADIVLMLNNALHVDYYILKPVGEMIETSLSDVTLYERHMNALNDKDSKTENNEESKEEEVKSDAEFTLVDENGEYDNADLIDKSYAENEEPEIPMNNKQELSNETDVDDFEYVPVDDNSIG